MAEVIPLKRRQTREAAKLTKPLVDRATYDPDDGKFSVFRDTEVHGFDLRVLPSCKTFVFRYKSPVDRRQRVFKLGRYPDITVTEARKLAEGARADVTRGIDPQDAKDRAKERASAIDFQTVAQRWLDEYASKHRKSWLEDKRRLFGESSHVRPLLRLKLRDSGREEFIDQLQCVHGNASTTPVEANRVVELVNALMNEAVRQRWVPVVYRNLAADIRKNTERAREDYLRATEFAKFARAVAGLKQAHRCAIWLMVLTGARSKSEVLCLAKSDVHHEAGVFVFRNTKNGTDHELPISNGIRLCLEHAPSAKGPQVFTVKDLRRAFQVISAAGFVGHITPHALRHTFRTHARASLNLPLEVVDAITNHVSNYGAGARYVHANTVAIRDALEQFEQWAFAQAGIEDFAAYLSTGRL